jgi:hypothetical protein
MKIVQQTIASLRLAVVHAPAGSSSGANPLEFHSGFQQRTEGVERSRAVRDASAMALDYRCSACKHFSNYRLSESLANAVLLTYPDAGHGSLFQYPESFTRHAAAFLSSDSESAAF